MKSKSKSTKLLREYIKELVVEEAGPTRLRIFDFDDTLVVTDAKVLVTHADGKERVLTPAEFAVYDRKKGDKFDYSEFNRLINPRTIVWTYKILKGVYDKYGSSGLVILSARTSARPIRQFLHSVGMDDVKIRALNDPDPVAKAKWVDGQIRRLGLDEVEFFDDSHKNIAAIKNLQRVHPDVRIIVRHVVHTVLPTHGFMRHYGTRRRKKR